MQDIKLSDQLGAMAIIDELYQKQQLLLEHLDRDKLRSNLKESIKSYYQAKGQIVDNQIIEEGINRWFDHRLRFNAPKRSWFQHLLVRCYIKRKAISIVVGVILFLSVIVVYSKLSVTKDIKANIDNYYSQILMSKNTLTELKNQFTKIDNYPIHYAQIPAKKLKASIASLLNQDLIPTLVKPTVAGSFITESEQETYNKFKQASLTVSDKLSEIRLQMKTLNTLLEDDRRLAELIKSDQFIKESKQYPVLQHAVDSVIDNLNQGQQVVDFSQIEMLYNSIDRAKAIANKIQADNNQFLALNVPDSDMRPVLALQDVLQADLKNLSFDNVENYQKMIAYYLKLAQTNLTLTIVDNPYYKSGVERTHENTNGKSWYIIVTPTLPNGDTTSLWVKSIETGETEFVDMFGQQVTEKAYNSVRADKIDDGHIDNNQLCNKPKGRLMFICPNSVKSGRILEW